MCWIHDTLPAERVVCIIFCVIVCAFTSLSFEQAVSSTAASNIIICFMFITF